MNKSVELKYFVIFHTKSVKKLCIPAGSLSLLNFGQAYILGLAQLFGIQIFLSMNMTPNLYLSLLVFWVPIPLTGISTYIIKQNTELLKKCHFHSKFIASNISTQLVSQCFLIFLLHHIHPVERWTLFCPQSLPETLVNPLFGLAWPEYS